MEDNKYTVSDLIVAAYEQKPLDFEQMFNDIVVDRVTDAVTAKRFDVAQNMYGEEKMTPRMSNSEIMDASSESPSPTPANLAAQQEYDRRLELAKLAAAGTKQVIKHIGKSVAGPVGGVIGSVVANRLYKQ